MTQQTVATLIDDLSRHPGLVIYGLVGLLVAIGYMRRERMFESANNQRDAIGILLVLLIGIWPLLLLAMFLNYLQFASNPATQPDHTNRQPDFESSSPDSGLPTEVTDVMHSLDGGSNSLPQDSLPDL